MTISIPGSLKASCPIRSLIVVKGHEYSSHCGPNGITGQNGKYDRTIRPMPATNTNPKMAKSRRLSTFGLPFPLFTIPSH